MPDPERIQIFHQQYLNRANPDTFDHATCMDAAYSLIDREDLQVDPLNYADSVIRELPEEPTDLTDFDVMKIGVALEALRDHGNAVLSYYRKHGAIEDADYLTIDELFPCSEKQKLLENYYIEGMNEQLLDTVPGKQAFLSIVAYSENLDRADAAWIKAHAVINPLTTERHSLGIELASHVISGLRYNKPPYHLHDRPETLVKRLDGLIDRTRTLADQESPDLDSPREEIARWLDSLVTYTQARNELREDDRMLDNLPRGTKELLIVCSQLVGRSQQLDALLRYGRDRNNRLHQMLREYGLRD